MSVMAPALALAVQPVTWSPRPVRPPVPSGKPIPRSGPRLCLVLVLFAGLLALGPRPPGGRAGDAAVVDPWSHDHVPGELLVGFRA
ncbi:MAG: hypothetical protein M3Q65_04945, partial [Chloroflexota bacterium]|nr:hypothetical protein [Chloroflexota bacterium]